MKHKTLALFMATGLILAMGANVSVYGETEGYQYGEGEVFHSDVPVIYSMLLPENGNFPYQEDWAVWSDIAAMSNVTLDVVTVPLADYDNSVREALKGDCAPYIIPYISDGTTFVDTEEVLPVSMYLKYMPNFSKRLDEWCNPNEIMKLYADDGRFYWLPAINEITTNSFSIIIRKDIFEASGIGLDTEEQWYWSDFANALRMVKNYTHRDGIWADVYHFGPSLALASPNWGVTAGYSCGRDWGMEGGVVYDEESQIFRFVDNTAEFKDFLTFFNSLYKDGLLDEDSFTQDAATVLDRFCKGESYALTGDYRTFYNLQHGNYMQDPEAKLFFLTALRDTDGAFISPSIGDHMDKGIMISNQALEDLGKEGLIKLLRFVDWLWYTDSGNQVTAYGLDSNAEEEHNADQDGIQQAEAGTEQKSVFDYENGYGQTAFSYGGNIELLISRMGEDEKDWNSRVYSCLAVPLALPRIDEADREQLEEYRLPLINYVNENALAFIRGEKVLESADWDEYVEKCVTDYRAAEFVEKINELTGR